MKPGIEENWMAVWMASRALDAPNADPDSDLCTISRQFLRLREQIANYRILVRELRTEIEQLRVLNNDTYEELLTERVISQRLNDDLSNALDVIKEKTDQSN